MKGCLFLWKFMLIAPDAVALVSNSRCCSGLLEPEDSPSPGKQAGDVANILVEECHLPVAPKYCFSLKYSIFNSTSECLIFNFFGPCCWWLCYLFNLLLYYLSHEFIHVQPGIDSELVAELDNQLPSLLPTCKSKPGATELVAHLNANRVPLAIATSSRWKRILLSNHPIHFRP